MNDKCPKCGATQQYFDGAEVWSTDLHNRTHPYYECYSRGSSIGDNQSPTCRIRELEAALRPFAEQYERLSRNAGIEPEYVLTDYERAAKAMEGEKR